MDLSIQELSNSVENAYYPQTTYCFKVEIAGKKIEIECFYKYVFKQCRYYLSDFEEPDYRIDATLRDIQSEIQNIPGINENGSRLDNRISVDYVGAESSAIYRKIADLMLNNRIVLIHGAAIAVHNKCYIFTAPSGTGKTTHINNWIEMIPDTIVVNGDKPLIDVDSKLVYGTPWCGKEGMNTNIAVPLAGIIALERGESNHIHSITFKEIIPTLIKQCYIPNNKELSIKALKLIGELNSIPYYKLYCNMDKESAEVAYNGLGK